jgi:hypothetical protein
MQAVLPNAVRVIPFEGRWCVAYGRGHYATPLAREEAIEQAIQLAKVARVPEIAICDGSGRTIEVLAVAEI